MRTATVLSIKVDTKSLMSQSLSFGFRWLKNSEVDNFGITQVLRLTFGGLTNLAPTSTTCGMLFSFSTHTLRFDNPESLTIKVNSLNNMTLGGLGMFALSEIDLNNSTQVKAMWKPFNDYRNDSASTLTETLRE